MPGSLFRKLKKFSTKRLHGKFVMIKKLKETLQISRKHLSISFVFCKAKDKLV